MQDCVSIEESRFPFLFRQVSFHCTHGISLRIGGAYLSIILSNNCHYYIYEQLRLEYSCNSLSIPHKNRRYRSRTTLWFLFHTPATNEPQPVFWPTHPGSDTHMYVELTSLPGHFLWVALYDLILLLTFTPQLQTIAKCFRIKDSHHGPIAYVTNQTREVMSPGTIIGILNNSPMARAAPNHAYLSIVTLRYPHGGFQVVWSQNQGARMQGQMRQRPPMQRQPQYDDRDDGCCCGIM